MASRSGVRIELDAAALPALPGALELAEAGVRTGGDRRNREFAGPHVESDAPRRARGARLRPADGRRAARLAPRRQGGRCSRRRSPRPGLPLYRIGRRGRTGDGECVAAESSPSRRERTAREPRGSPRRVPPARVGAVADALVVVTCGAVRPPRPPRASAATTGRGAATRRSPRRAATPIDRVRQPHRGARRHRPDAVHVARGPPGRRACPRWVRSVALAAVRSARSPRSRSAASRCSSIFTRSP